MKIIIEGYDELPGEPPIKNPVRGFMLLAMTEEGQVQLKTELQDVDFVAVLMCLGNYLKDKKRDHPELFHTAEVMTKQFPEALDFDGASAIIES